LNLPFGYSLESNFNGAGIYFFGLLCIAILYTYISNKHKGAGQLAKTSLLFILVARGVSVTLLLVLMFEPQISLERKFITPQKVAVVIDQSRSMNGAWQGSASELTTNILNFIANLEDYHKVDLWSMEGDEVQQGSLNFDEGMSIFGWNPALGDRELTKNLYSSVILISDGQLNGGRSPLDSPWTSVIPIYPLYPLLPKSSVELKILESTYQVSDSISGQIEIRIKLQQEGLVGKTANIQIRTAFDQLIGEVSVRLNQVFTDVSLRIKLPLLESQTLKIDTFIEGGEFNSTKYLNIEIQDPVKKVLIVSGRVNELHKFLMLSLADSLFKRDVVLGTTPKRENSFQTLTTQKYDLIILNEPGSTVLYDRLATTIQENIKSNCPVILFNSGLEPLDSRWMKLLDTQQQSTQYPSMDETAYWNQVASDHPFYIGLLGKGFAPDKILEYPPIRPAKYSQTFTGHALIGIGIADKYKAGFILGDTPPKAIFNGAGFWKWFFHPQSKDSFQKFWEYLLIYLNDIATFEPVKISLPVKSAPTGAFIEAEVVVKDLDNRIIPAAELRIWQEDESGQKQPLNLNRKESGAYSSQVNTNAPGLVALITEAYRFGELWGRDTSKLQLEIFNGEDQSRGVDEVLLERLAKRSGGQVIQGKTSEMPIIPVKHVSNNASYEFRGVRSSTLFVTLIMLLLLEWIIRRRTGLL